MVADDDVAVASGSRRRLCWWRGGGVAWWGPPFFPGMLFLFVLKKKFAECFLGTRRQKTLGKLAFAVNKVVECRLPLLSVFGTSPSAPGTRQISYIR